MRGPPSSSRRAKNKWPAILPTLPSRACGPRYQRLRHGRLPPRRASRCRHARRPKPELSRKTHRSRRTNRSCHRRRGSPCASTACVKASATTFPQLSEGPFLSPCRYNAQRRPRRPGVALGLGRVESGAGRTKLDSALLSIGAVLFRAPCCIGEENPLVDSFTGGFSYDWHGAINVPGARSRRVVGRPPGWAGTGRAALPTGVVKLPLPSLRPSSRQNHKCPTMHGLQFRGPDT
jgi:hypothetical protein